MASNESQAIMPDKQPLFEWDSGASIHFDSIIDENDTEKITEEIHMRNSNAKSDNNEDSDDDDVNNIENHNTKDDKDTLNEDKVPFTDTVDNENSEILVTELSRAPHIQPNEGSNICRSTQSTVI
eukprot:9560444-Ditylum_brightwellii.AAC.2